MDTRERSTYSGVGPYVHLFEVPRVLIDLTSCPDSPGNAPSSTSAAAASASKSASVIQRRKRRRRPGDDDPRSAGPAPIPRCLYLYASDVAAASGYHPYKDAGVSKAARALQPTLCRPRPRPRSCPPKLSPTTPPHPRSALFVLSARFSLSPPPPLPHPHYDHSQELVMQYVYQGWDRMLWSDARKVRSASASSTD